MAIPSQGLWRLSSTLTYADAAGLALGMCLLVALGLDLTPALVRIVVCLTAAGLLATQSRGAYVAFLGACLVVPWRRYVQFAVPLLAGIVVGACAIASSPAQRAVPWLGLRCLAGRGGVGGTVAKSGSAFPRERQPGSALSWSFWWRTRRRCRAASRDRASSPGAERSGPIRRMVDGTAPMGIRAIDRRRAGPPPDLPRGRWIVRPLRPQRVPPDRSGRRRRSERRSSPLSVVAVVRVVRRTDLLASCAVAALVCFAIGGAFDFDWHLSLVGLLGGWCVGLAATQRSGVAQSESREGRRRQRRSARHRETQRAERSGSTHLAVR